MASINDLATAATIASSAVALQASPKPEASQSTPPPRSPSLSAVAAALATPPTQTGSSSESIQAARPDYANEDGDSITVATGAPPILAAPLIISPQAAPAPPPVASDGETVDALGIGGPDESRGASNEHSPTGDSMDGVEKEAEPVPQKPVRGTFVVFEGMDRAGKTTQAKLLQQRCIESGREVRFLRFPGELEQASEAHDEMKRVRFC